MRPGLENDPLPQGPTPTGDSELRALTVEKLPRPRPPSGLRRTGPGAACLPAPTNPSPRLREGPLEGAAAAPPRPAPRHRPQRETPSTGPGRARAGSYFSAGAGRAARGAWRVARGPRVRGQHVPRRTRLLPEQRGLRLAPHTPGHLGLHLSPAWLSRPGPRGSRSCRPCRSRPRC